MVNVIIFVGSTNYGDTGTVFRYDFKPYINCLPFLGGKFVPTRNNISFKVSNNEFKGRLAFLVNNTIIIPYFRTYMGREVLDYCYQTQFSKVNSTDNPSWRFVDNTSASVFLNKYNLIFNRAEMPTNYGGITHKKGGLIERR